MLKFLVTKIVLEICLMAVLQHSISCTRIIIATGKGTCKRHASEWHLLYLRRFKFDLFSLTPHCIKAIEFNSHIHPIKSYTKCEKVYGHCSEYCPIEAFFDLYCDFPKASILGFYSSQFFQSFLGIFFGFLFFETGYLYKFLQFFLHILQTVSYLRFTNKLNSINII